MFARIATTALLLLPTARAFWILGHSGPVVTEPLDPIVNPGTVSPHMHSVGGSDAFAPTISTKSLKAGSCSTQPVQADMSSYWVPQLYHRNSNGTYSAIPVLFMNVYYLPRGGPNTKKVEAFPDDLRMIAGDQTRTTFNASSFADTAISYVCLDYSRKDVQPPQHTFPTDNCPDGVRAQAVFPSCWDGENLDSADHKSHMAYPIQAVDSGDCPASHPRKVVTIFYEWVYNVAKFSGRGEDAWVFANGGNANSFHADFATGWDRDTLQAAIDQCGDRSDIFNDVEKCAPLNASVDRKKADACRKQAQVDQATGLESTLATLPGCNRDLRTNKAAKCDGSAPTIRGDSPSQPGSGSSSAVSAPSASSSTSAAPYSYATPSVTASVNVPGGNLAVSTPAAASPAPTPTKVCKRSERAAEALAEKRKRAVHNHVRRSANRLSGAH